MVMSFLSKAFSDCVCVVVVTTKKMEAKNKLMVAFGWTRLKDNKEGNGEMLILAESQSTADFIKASNELASCLDCKMGGGSQDIVDNNQHELFFQDQVFFTVRRVICRFYRSSRCVGFCCKPSSLLLQCLQALSKILRVFFFNRFSTPLQVIGN